MSVKELNQWRREQIATAVLAGLVAGQPDPPQFNHRGRAEYAIAAADALIAELDKAKP